MTSLSNHWKTFVCAALLAAGCGGSQKDASDPSETQTQPPAVEHSTLGEHAARASVRRDAATRMTGKVPTRGAPPEGLPPPRSSTRVASFRSAPRSTTVRS